MLLHTLIYIYISPASLLILHKHISAYTPPPHFAEGLHLPAEHWLTNFDLQAKAIKNLMAKYQAILVAKKVYSKYIQSNYYRIASNYYYYSILSSVIYTLYSP